MKKQDDGILYLGIDPGKSGAFALISKECDVKILEDWPGNEVQLAQKIEDIVGIYYVHNTILCALEHVHSMPRDAKKAAFSFGMNNGMWLQVLACNKISTIQVSPQKWKNALIKKSDGEKKQGSVNVASRIFPSMAHQLVGPKGGLKDGRADALLIAYWRSIQ